jgi:hypothetical protein
MAEYISWIIQRELDIAAARRKLRGGRGGADDSHDASMRNWQDLGAIRAEERHKRVRQRLARVQPVARSGGGTGGYDQGIETWRKDAEHRGNRRPGAGAGAQGFGRAPTAEAGRKHAGAGVPQLSRVGPRTGAPQLSGVAQRTGTPQLSRVGHRSGAPQLSGVAQQTGTPQLSRVGSRTGAPQLSGVTQQTGTPQLSRVGSRTGAPQLSGVTQQIGAPQLSRMGHRSGAPQLSGILHSNRAPQLSRVGSRTGAPQLSGVMQPTAGTPQLSRVGHRAGAPQLSGVPLRSGAYIPPAGPLSGRSKGGLTGTTAARLAAIPGIGQQGIPGPLGDKMKPPPPHATMAHSPVTPREVNTLGGPTAGVNLQELVYEPPQPGNQGDGRYIPYTGGSLGWFENCGVSKVEQPNDYQFFMAIDSDWVVMTQLERSGMRKDRRSTSRHRLNPETLVALIVGEQLHAAKCKNLSASGFGAQVIADLQAVYKSDPIRVQIHDKSGKNLLLELTGSVAWAEKSVQAGTTWTFGIVFPELTPKQSEMVLELSVERR